MDPSFRSASIRIHDFGQEPDGLLYIAMDYLNGRDLLDVISEEFGDSTIQAQRASDRRRAFTWERPGLSERGIESH